MIGVIGIGAMGGGIVATLLREKYEVKALDIDPEKVAAVVAKGAVAAHDAADLIGTCDPIILSLPSSAVTVGVLEDTVLPHVQKGQTVIDAGTTIVAEIRRLHEAYLAKGAMLIDAPVSGGPQGAGSGTLYIFVGGDRHATDAQWPLLAKLGGSRLTYCGSSGCGQVVKAVNQLAMGLTQAALIETVAFGVNAGVGADILIQAVGGDDGFRGEFEKTAAKIAAGQGNAMDSKYAEFNYFLNESQRAGFPMPILENLHEWMSRRPESERDNMGRPFPPLWESLVAT